MSNMVTEKDIQKNFTDIQTVFTGKETEDNWEGRNASVTKLNEMLNSDNMEEYKEYFVRNVHKEVSNFIKSIHSLRTSFAIAGLLLISTISTTLGTTIDHYTAEIILSNLLQCSTATKKLISAKVSEVTIIFLSNTKFYPKLMTMLCKSTTNKNIQLRTFCCKYILTVLETHGSKEILQRTINNSESSLELDSFLRKSLSDASPLVRNASQLLYNKYQECFPNKATNLFKTLDSSTQKKLEGIPSVKSLPTRPTIPNVKSPPTGSSIPKVKPPLAKPSITKSKSSLARFSISESKSSLARSSLPKFKRRSSSTCPTPKLSLSSSSSTSQFTLPTPTSSSSSLTSITNVVSSTKSKTPKIRSTLATRLKAAATKLKIKKAAPSNLLPTPSASARLKTTQPRSIPTSSISKLNSSKRKLDSTDTENISNKKLKK